MPRTDVATQVLAPAGTNVALTAPIIDGDIVDVPSILRVKTGATPTNVTIQVPLTINGLTVGPRVVAVPANSERDIPVRDSSYKQPVGAVVGARRALVDYSSVATVTRAVVR
ncbi:MAG: hypothetical protein ACRCZP_16785 [Phycicoccus sp.]